MYNTILFDLDGTIINSKEGITKSVQYALSFFGIEEPDLTKLECFIGPPLINSFMEYYHFSEEDAKKAVEYYRKRFAPIGIHENVLYSGISNLLFDLKQQGKLIVLATSKPESFAYSILEKYNLISYFDLIVGSTLDNKRTAKQEIIEEVFHRLSYSQEEKQHAVMIGDRKHDIIGALACHIDCIGIRYGFAKENELEENHPNYIFDTVDELSNFLLQQKNLHENA